MKIATTLLIVTGSLMLFTGSVAGGFIFLGLGLMLFAFLNLKTGK